MTLTETITETADELIAFAVTGTAITCAVYIYIIKMFRSSFS